MPAPHRGSAASAIRREGALIASVALLGLLASACTGTRKLMDPTLTLETSFGTELGVATEYGVVFLGHTARAGDVDITAWFGDGPSVESTVIEPVGGGLYTAETEIRLPWVPLTFEAPGAGSRVTVIGRDRDGETWQSEVRVATHPRVSGLLLEIPSRLRDAPGQVGAGVFVPGERDEEVNRETMRLLGLVSGKVRLETGEGAPSEYLTVMGPQDLWRLVSYHRTDVHKRRWVYRGDIL